jgi:hypothetical protein
MKEILQCSEKTDENQGEIEVQESPKDEEQKEPKDDRNQPSIFDF